jgi:type I restriction enzyme S subunit
MELKPGYKQTEVGVIPEDWEVKSLGALFEITSSKRVFQSEWKTQGVPFYRARELAVLGETGAVDNELFITREMFDRYRRQYGVPTRGDMLVTGVGTLGKTYVVSGNHEFYFKDGNIIWFKINESLSSEFLRQLYLTPIISKQIGDSSAGTTVGTYTISNAKKTIIPFPPLREQHAIAKALSDMDEVLSWLDRLITKKRDLKQAATQQLITGQTRLAGFNCEWKETTLGEIGECVIGLTYEPKNVVNHGLLVLRSSNIQNGRLTYDDNVYVNIDVPDPLITRTGDILICVRNGSRALIGKCAVIDESAAGLTFGAFMSVFRTKYWRFIAYAFQAHDIQRQIRDNIGATINQITNKDMKSFRVKLPCEDEQVAIAAVLSDMDTEIAAFEQRREKTRALKQAMVQELLTGKTRLVTEGGPHA